MKKRICFISLLLLISLVPVSAGENKVSLAPAVVVTQGEDALSILGTTSKAEGKWLSLGLTLQGTTLFSHRGDAGMFYKTSLIAPIDFFGNDKDFNEDALIWDLGAGVAYQKDYYGGFTEIGAGLEYSLQIAADENVTKTVHTFAVGLYVEFNFYMESDFCPMAGISLSFPLIRTMSAKGSGITAPGTYYFQLVTYAPYFGFSYTY